ncbi:S10 family serine carboxypeptidase-like protein [Burkholderia stagnalis]
MQASTPTAGAPTSTTPVTPTTGTPTTGTPATGTPAVAADQPYTDPNTYSTDASAALPASAAFDQAAVTHHTINLGNKTASYTATAGHLTAMAPGAKTDKEVSFFYVAYTLDNQPVGSRPVTFFWNGGPGSSTIWLHLGSWGPKTLDIDEASLTPAALQTQPASFPLVDNDVTMLNDSDIVFVDAPGTGYSEAVAPHQNKDFWGVDNDAAAFRDFINRYISVNGRQTSPKYLYGESYGGIRTPIVANLLEQQGSPGQGGPALTGVILNSPALSYKTNCYMMWNFSGGYIDYTGSSVETGNWTKTVPNVSCAGFIPSYAAISYSLKNPLSSAQDVGTYVNQAVMTTSQQWLPNLLNYTNETAGSYAPYDPSIFSSGDQTLFSMMATLTGLTSLEWATAYNMNVPDFASATLNLAANQWDKWGQWSRMDRYNGLVMIPAGTNYVGSDGTPLGPNGQDAEDYNDPAFANEIKTYLPGFLKYTSQSTYAIEPPAVINAWNWNHGSDLSTHPTSLPDLTEALTLDPGLKVVVFHGYHDLACPYYQGVQDIAGAGLASSVPVKAFPGGHMIYLTKSSRTPMKAQIDTFFGASS